MFLIAILMLLVVSLLVVLAFHIGAKALKDYHDFFGQETQKNLSDFFLFIDSKRLWYLSWGMSFSSGLLTYIITEFAIPAILMAMLSCLAPHVLLRWWRYRRLKLFDSQLPDFLNALSAALRSGVALIVALQRLSAESAPPLGQEFSLMLKQLKLGTSLEEGLNELVQRMPSESCQLLVASFRIAQQTGGNLANALDQMAQTLRERHQLQGKIQALTAQGKMQAWVMAILPFGVMFAMYQLDPQSTSILWASTPGNWVLLLIGVLEFAGLWMIRRIVRIDC